MMQPTTRSWAASGCRVLVVEDHEDTRDMLGTLLEDEGFEVALTGDAVAALEVAAAWQPDLVLVDLRLPVIDGVQLTRALRARESSRWVPIVACTGYTQRAVLDGAIDAGCDGVLIKPFDGDALIASVRAALAPRERPTRPSEQRITA